MGAHQTIMKKIAQNHIDLQESLAQTLKIHTSTEKQDTIIQSLRNLDTTTHKLLEEVVDGRTRTTHELRNEIRLIARTLSALANGQDVAA
jgi:G:T/U-mismatch repair DNA glycosylase